MMMLMTQDDRGINSSSKIIAVDLLGFGWRLWEPVLQRLRMGDITRLNDPKLLSKAGTGISLGGQDPVSPYHTMPCAFYVLRKMFQYACMPSKPVRAVVSDERLKLPATSTPVYKSNIQRRFSRISLARRKSAATASDLRLDNADGGKRFLEAPRATVDMLIPSPEQSAHQKTKTLPRQQQSILPLETPSLPQGDATANSMTLPQVARQSLLLVAETNWQFFSGLVCLDLATAGLKEGDWERVRVTLKAGISLVLRQVGDTFRCQSFSYSCRNPICTFRSIFQSSWSPS